MLPLLDAKLGYKTSVSCSFLGRRYRLADLTLKLGGAIVASRQAGGSAGGAGGSQFIGHVLHVEYGPACGSPADAQPIINDFVDLLNGMLAEVEADDAAGAAAAATAAATAVTTGSASGGAAATTAGLSAPASGRFQLFTPSGGAVCYRVPAAPDGGGWGPGHEAAQFVELAVQLTMSTSTKGKQ